MDCIVWAQKMVATNSTTAQTGRTLGDREDGLESEDIQRILSVSLLDSTPPSATRRAVKSHSRMKRRVKPKATGPMKMKITTT